MCLRPRDLRRLFLSASLSSALTLTAFSAFSQNLLVNPGFDRDLSGWIGRVRSGTSTQPTADVFFAWEAVDASGSPGSGGAALHAKAYEPSTLAAVGQCRAITALSLATFGARFLVRTERLSDIAVSATYYASEDCSGERLGTASTPPIPSSITGGSNSGGAWLPVQTSALVPAAARSVFVEVTASALWTWSFGAGWADVVADDAFLTDTPATLTTSLLPSAGWVHGAGGAYWITELTLVNPGLADAAVTLRFLPHDPAAHGGSFAYTVKAGQTLAIDPETWEINFPESYGAILVTSSAPSVFLQSQTYTNVLSGGTVGQALAALGAADFAGSTPKTLAPIRENAAFRTNLVLANAAEAPLTAHVALYAADGPLLGETDAALPALGMTQISRVAAQLGAANLDAGRISVSTPTPGGLVAAYASVIDNVTNDPRTLLPQDAAPATPGANLLMNSGFDRDLSGWTLTLSAPDPNASRSGAWDSGDAGGSAQSGSAHLVAGSVGFGGYGWSELSQCVPVTPGRTYGLRARVRGSSWGWVYGSAPWPGLGFSFYASANCSGSSILQRSAGVNPFAPSAPDSWLLLPVAAVAAPADARSARVDLWAAAAGEVHGSGIGASFDDVGFSEGLSASSSWIPAASSIVGVGGSRWTTTLSLANPGTGSATVYVNGFVTNLAAGQTLSLPDFVHDKLGLSQTWLPLSVLATSPAIAVTAETSTPTPGGGTVGQALAAFRDRDFAGAEPKSIAPVRDSGAFRTNLVLANVTSAPLVAHVDLFDSSGSLIGSRDVPLDAGAATQIGGVGSSLSGGSIDSGRISISTPTPGGLVAAYASVIDNATNDPRTLLPR